MGVDYGCEVIGFKPPDAKFKKMLKAYRACWDAGIVIPEDLQEYFGEDEPDESGVRVPLLLETIVEGDHGADDQTITLYELKVKDIPEGVTVLKFRMFYC